MESRGIVVKHAKRYFLDTKFFFRFLDDHLQHLLTIAIARFVSWGLISYFMFLLIIAYFSDNPLPLHYFPSQLQVLDRHSFHPREDSRRGTISQFFLIDESLQLIIEHFRLFHVDKVSAGGQFGVLEVWIQALHLLPFLI